MVGAWVVKIHSQKSGVKSEELVVERSLKLDALNLNWLGVIDGPPLQGQFRKEYPLSLKKKKREICVLCLLNLVSLLSVENR